MKSLFVLVLFLPSPSFCFHLAHPTFHIKHKTSRYSQHFRFGNTPNISSKIYNSRLHSSESNNENVDMMRQMLEASWNVDSMGIVPSTPESAAEAAATAISNARDNNNMNMLLIDILLPTYDITEGENLYDEILAAEFCIALANSIKEQSDLRKAALLVKNGKSVRTINRVLEMKEQRMLEGEEEEEDDDDDEEDTDEIVDDLSVQDLDGIGSTLEFNDFDDIGTISAFSSDFDDSKNNESKKKTNKSTQSNVSADEYNDFDDLSSISSFADDFTGETDLPENKQKFDTDSTSDVDSFRQQLMSSWDEPTVDNEATMSSNLENFQNDQKPTKKKKPKPKKKKASMASLPKCYRVGSLLGDKLISSGPDMFDNVIAAVDETAVPKENENEEDTLIILSSASQEEMIAIRRLIAKYKSTKTIIFVNCKLNPLPREMIRATTVYSILPLLAKPVVSETNILAKKQDPSSQPPPTKVVLMRRFPRDWELFADLDGAGFEMIDSVPASAVGAKGPSMEWVSSCVKNYMKLKFDGR